MPTKRVCSELGVGIKFREAYCTLVGVHSSGMQAVCARICEEAYTAFGRKAKGQIGSPSGPTCDQIETKR